jgi:chromate transporter
MDPEPTAATPQPAPSSGTAREVLLQFLRLGAIAFGGPAAHLGLMQDEFVRRRKWIDEQGFLDFVGATNLIPGPNSTELAMYLGQQRAGWRGLIAAGTGFTLPAFVIVLLLSIAYASYGATPQGIWILASVKPVVVAVIAYALWTLGRRAVKGWITAGIGLAAFAAYFLVGWGELTVIGLGGLCAALALNYRKVLRRSGALPAILFLPPSLQSEAVNEVLRLFLTFAKIGAVLYGTGYVLIAFLYGEFIDTGVLTQQQLIDAVAIGQVTPGPLFTTATFIGYQLAGVPGAIAATVGIFLPSFVFVLISSPWIPRMRRSPWLGAFLDGVNVSALALMGGVTLRLARAAVVDTVGLTMAVVAAILLIRLRVSATWLVLAGIGVGLVRYLLST